MQLGSTIATDLCLMQPVFFERKLTNVKTPCGYLISETDRRHARASQLANRVPLSFPLYAGL